MNERLYLGIEIGGTKLQVVLGNDHGNIIDRRRFQVVRERGAVGIREQISEAVTIFLRHHRISGVGVGFGGPVNWVTGQVACSHHVEGWGDFRLGRWLEEMVRAPVRVDNDANTAALAEATRGAGMGTNPVFYVTLGSGVGGGLVLDGKIFHGQHPGEAEIGHVRLDKSGATVEDKCSGWAVDRRIREELKSGKPSRLAELVGERQRGEARYLGPAIEQGDSLGRRILEEVAEDLAFGLSHVTHLIHPETIVLGGGLSLLGVPLRTSVARQLPRFLMEAFRPGPEIRIAASGEDVVPIGALLLARVAAEGRHGNQ